MCPAAEHAQLVDVVRRKPGSAQEVLRHQLEDAGMLCRSVSNVTLVSIGLAAVLLEKRGSAEAAEQLRDAELTGYLSGERPYHVDMSVVS